MEQRFILEKDNVVLDKQTGLMWQRSASNDRIVWKGGFDYIDKLNTENFAGYNDWRYPTKDELATIIVAEENRTTGLYIDPHSKNSAIAGPRHSARIIRHVMPIFITAICIWWRRITPTFCAAVRTRNRD